MKKNLKYHHLGIPTTEVQKNETYLKDFKVYVSGYYTSNFKIEWMRFEKDSPTPELVKNVLYVAFEVDDLNEAIKEKEILFFLINESFSFTKIFDNHSLFVV